MGRYRRGPKQFPPAYVSAGAIVVLLASIWLVGGVVSFVDALRTRPGQITTWLTLLPIGALALSIFWVVQGLRRHRDRAAKR